MPLGTLRSKACPCLRLLAWPGELTSHFTVYYAVFVGHGTGICSYQPLCTLGLCIGSRACMTQLPSLLSISESGPFFFFHYYYFFPACTSALDNSFVFFDSCFLVHGFHSNQADHELNSSLFLDSFLSPKYECFHEHDAAVILRWSTNVQTRRLWKHAFPKGAIITLFGNPCLEPARNYDWHSYLVKAGAPPKAFLLGRC